MISPRMAFVVRLIICAGLFLLFHERLCAQDTLYYDAHWGKLTADDDFDYQCILAYETVDSTRARERCLRRDHTLYSEKSYSDYKKKQMDGVCKTWYRDGLLHTDVQYRFGKFDSTLKSYWPNGVLKRDDFFENGTLIRGMCFDSSGREVPYYDFEQMPEFPGGPSAMIEYLKREVRYPPKARRNGIAGKVFISFEIDKQGAVTNVAVLRGVDPLLDEEARRVVLGMPAWTPGSYDGDPVRVQYNLPIKFSLN